jgi:hypothetical protein
MASMAREGQTIKRFANFFLKEQRLKWNVYLSSVGIALAWALIRFVAFHKSEDQVSLEAGTIVCALVAVAVAVYVVQGRIWPVRGETADLVSYLRSHLKLAAAGATLGLFLVVFMAQGEVQASIADLTLAHIASQLDADAARPAALTGQATSLSAEQLEARFQRVESVVANSSANNIPVDVITLKATQSALSRYLLRRTLPDQVNQAGWTAAIELQSLARTRDVETGQVASRQVAKEGYVLQTPLLLDHDLHLQGQHSALVVNAGIEIKGAFISFDGLDFEDSQIPLILMDDQAGALVSDSIFQGGAQALDRIVWVNVRFENTSILYNQGPLRLRNVSFRNCDLRNLQSPFHIEQELLRRIQESNGQPLTYVYEPPTAEPKGRP